MDNKQIKDLIIHALIQLVLVTIVYISGDYFLFNNPYISISIIAPVIFIVRAKDLNSTMLHIITYFIFVGSAALASPLKELYNSDFREILFWGYPKLFALIPIWFIANEQRLKGVPDRKAMIINSVVAIILSSGFTFLFIMLFNTHFNY